MINKIKNMETVFKKYINKFKDFDGHFLFNRLLDISEEYSVSDFHKLEAWYNNNKKEVNKLLKEFKIDVDDNFNKNIENLFSKGFKSKPPTLKSFKYISFIYEH
jgi:hypothetical protein